MKLLFPLILILFFALIHYLVYSRVVKKLHISKQSFFWLRILLIVNFTAIIGYVSARYLYDFPLPFYYLFSLSIGVGFILFVTLILYEFLHFLQRTIPFHEERRALFKRFSDIGFLSLGAVYVGSAVIEGSKEPVVEYVTVDQKRFDGKRYRIVQISDMHIGGLIEKNFVSLCVEKINALHADLVVITGDLVDAPIEQVSQAIDELMHLNSRLGTFYVTGNHEYFHGVENTLAYLERLGITVLANSAQPLEKFWIVGVHDLFGSHYGLCEPDIDKALQGVPSDANTLLLAHQPRFISELNNFKPSLILSGHTHGGQIWPFGYFVSIVQPYLKGLHSIGTNRHIYVNSGIGFWGPPMRLGSQSEITCIDWS